GALTAEYQRNVQNNMWYSAATILNAFNDEDILAKLRQLGHDQLEALRQAATTINVGDGRMLRMINAIGEHHVASQQNETVAGRVYTVSAGYTYTLTGSSVRVTVGMNFLPDRGVHVPTGTWFGYIRHTWNHFSVVNQANRAEKLAIEFDPEQAAGHDIQVSAGDGRANAGHYYTGVSDNAQAVPHEFGHLIGLEDEYERDAGDFQRVTGEAPPAGSGAVAAATTIATGIHDGLALAEGEHETHLAAERRRMRAVNHVLAQHHIVPNYNWGRSSLTREVAIQYAAKYGHEMSVDFSAQVDSDNDECNTWRERVLGSFEVTSTSIMGDMTNHTHPVEARHVRAFAGYVQQALGHGTWQPERDH
ncbi:MAG TPA: hypothetical protein VKV34_09070, partial [Thermoleophilia bacterium]|nr:hypothetical protein [Thermoleophilia bacterium]